MGDRKRLINDKSFHAYIYSSVRNRSLNYLRDTHSVSIEGFEKQSDEDFLREMMEEEVYRECMLPSKNCLNVVARFFC